jgi:ABC-type multidrug transport system ATPase subunit
MIESLKENHVLLLTTHAMEEAEHLGEQIAILSNGVCLAQGTSLSLKNEYGKGYQVSLLTGKDNLTNLKGLVQDLLPGAEFLQGPAEEQKGSLTVGVPKKSKDAIPKFFGAIEEAKVVKEWGKLELIQLYD